MLFHSPLPSPQDSVALGPAFPSSYSKPIQSCFSPLFLRQGSCYAVEAGLELEMILLPQPPDCWGYMCVPPRQLSRVFLNCTGSTSQIQTPFLTLDTHSAGAAPGPVAFARPLVPWSQGHHQQSPPPLVTMLTPPHHTLHQPSPQGSAHPEPTDLYLLNPQVGDQVPASHSVPVVASEAKACSVINSIRCGTGKARKKKTLKNFSTAVTAILQASSALV